MTNIKAQRTASTVAPTTAPIEKPKDSGFVTVANKTEINYIHAIMLFGIPLVSLVGILTTPLQLNTFIFAVIMYFWTGLGITAGYHRLWSHRAYSAKWIVRMLLCIGGAAAFEGSAKWWCRNHRAHHRYVDSERDPYNAKNGFWYSHMGWMLVKQKANQIGYADISDLNRDPMILWQHKYYPFVSIGFGVIFPTIVAALWGDAWGGYFYAGTLRIVFVHHATFFVNSLAHSFGEKNFSDMHTSFDSVITAILTLGEGYHNFHHEFPQDYRNGIKVYHYDPTKWLISGLSRLGLVYNLKWIADSEIEKARVQMQERNLGYEKAQAEFGADYENLPPMTMPEFLEKSKKENLVIIDGIAHDVTSFVHDHPGGRQTLLNQVGTDATFLFEGENEKAHKHSKEAKKYLFGMRVARITN
jgi:stearoyl-CoA desaturase (delta-9 desaturase)